MINCKFSILLIIFNSLPFLVLAQNNFKLLKQNDFYTVIEYSHLENDTVFIPNLKYTSLSIEYFKPDASPIIVISKQRNGEQKLLNTFVTNQSAEQFQTLFSTPLQIFDTVQNELSLIFSNHPERIKIHLIYAPIIPTPNYLALKKSTNKCDKPEMISFTIWRNGLPDPKPPRESTTVEHLVVHHSAGNNADTNYINMVRNIYLFHTQSNNWDDIGYNYLIAPNGVIFMGRDPQGVASEDNILGAHFCGKNKNMMGVCMMGDFMKIKPSTQALSTLTYLLAWKLKKDKIDALGQTIHPKITGNLLNNVCGHRDGCSTDCPGDFLYFMLGEIKQEAARIADSCGLVLGIENYEIGVSALYPNPTNGSVTYTNDNRNGKAFLKIFNLSGQLVFKNEVNSGQTFDLFLPAGLYFYQLNEKNTEIKNYKLLIN